MDLSLIKGTVRAIKAYRVAEAKLGLKDYSAAFRFFALCKFHYKLTFSDES